jgi:tetratricopeptide (TPR) repeat protein
LPDRLRDLIVDSAEGNPFYAEELVQMLIDEDVITTVGAAGDETWHVDLARLGGVKVPPALTGILQARLDGLPADERAVLQRAAVVGRMFWDSAVTELMADKADLARVNGLLADARARELVFRREQSAFSGCAEYSFKHAILRDVTYETVLLKLRRKYHAQVAAWLETQAADRQAEYLGVIAGHYELAGEGYKAAQYLHRWGAENMAISAYASAEDAFERGLGVLPLTSSDSREAPDASLTSLRLALLIGLGQAKARMGDLAPATEQLKLAVGLARERAMSHAEAEALVYLGIIAREQGRYREAVENLQPALVLAEASGDRTIEALARRELSVVAYHRGEYDRATAWAEEARSLYEELGHRSGLAGTLNLLGVIEQMQTGHLDQATEYYEQALRLAKETGDRRMLVSVLNNLGDTDHTRGLYDAARARFEECRTILEEIGERPTMAIVLFNLADLHANLGQDDLAQGYIRESIDYGQAAGMTAWCLYDLIIQARLDRRAGRFVRAAELLGLVRNHPSGDQQAFDMLAPDLDALRQDLSEADLEAAVVRGASLDLGQVLQSLRSGP